MASKGGVIAVAAGAGLLALFAFTRKAKANPKQTPAPEDMHSAEACKAYKVSRTSLVNARSQIQSQLNDVNNAMAAAADAGDEAALANLVSIRQNLQGALANANGEIAKVDNLIAGCA